MPEIIITPQELNQHRIEKYAFRSVNSIGEITETENSVVTNKPQPFTLKSIDLTTPPKSLNKEEPSLEIKDTSENLESQEENSKLEKFSPPSIEDVKNLKEHQEEIETLKTQREELMKKIDELSTQVIKLEMSMEKSTEEHESLLEEQKESSFNEGFTKGSKEMEEKYQEEMNAINQHLRSSIKKLDSSITLYENGLKSLESELTTVALDIAQEVTTSEVEKNSSKIAKALASNLLKEVKDATQVTIKVSPKDKDELKDLFSELEKIKIESDEAVSPGGVIILSDVGNINGDIHARYQEIKKHSLENE